MTKLIKNRQVIEDDWQILAATEEPASVELPEGKLIVPLNVWNEQGGELINRDAPVGVWLDSDQPPALIAEYLQGLELVAINFPAFTDGRGYSYARDLRQAYDFKGEVRAIGDVLRDQLFFMQRCGFDSFALREDLNAEEAIDSLADFAETYQAATDQPDPLFKRR